MSKKLLSRPDFERAIARLPKMGTRSRQIAQSVLVDGCQQTEVAQKYGITKGAVWQCVQKVWKVHEETAQITEEGLQQVTAVLPPHQAFLVRKWDRSRKGQ
ncbi:TrfB-related DNA-binding protein [Thiocystis violacea]|uniref:TrfB-related DNA-binding protein n=1 Tax=Thiocystis violacea TaxID=13725 RepID=UPI0019055E70|nr:TrfB-related DNA-binding protein [Thiocystis violacea]